MQTLSEEIYLVECSSLRFSYLLTGSFSAATTELTMITHDPLELLSRQLQHPTDLNF